MHEVGTKKSFFARINKNKNNLKNIAQGLCTVLCRKTCKGFSLRGTAGKKCVRRYIGNASVISYITSEKMNRVMTLKM